MNSNEPPYRTHLHNSQDLVTTPAAKRAGFVTAVLEKSKLADSFIRDARTLRAKASAARTPEDLLNLEDIQAALLTAAGVSDKAANYLDANDRREILREYVKNVLAPAGDKFVEELVYRFLLTRGDTLGGKVRNLVGVWAQRQFTNYIVSEFRVAGRELRWLDARRTRWQPIDVLTDPDQVRAFAWTTGYLPRVLAYNVGVPLIKTDEEMAGESASAEDARSRGGKNVDLCLLHTTADAYIARPTRPRAVKESQHFVALGELKGGIDPAGADEHWKTASAHLARIRRSFAALGVAPALFFIGNAIETSMAGEIWGMLERGELTNAANMTDDRQAVSLVSWLCKL
ncbi:MAG TPA: restriction endonuclease [Chloroflexi bacterium]|nr:restriction endonuclease [Chloroflexota bacterium]